MTGRRIRICVATSYRATEEPRGPRYAAELARLGPDFEVIFVDCVPRGEVSQASAEFRYLQNVTSRSWKFPWRGGGRVRLLAEKIQQRLANLAFRRTGEIRTELLSTRAIGLEKMLIAERADLYFGFNIDTLFPVCNAARRHGVPFMFDCHEIHAEMAHDQSAMERAVIREVQRRCLPECALVTAASPQAAEFLEREFGIRNVLPLLNAAPLENLPPGEATGEFSLYWRNATVDLGLRGLDDILHAMPLLPDPILLYLQGRPALKNKGRVEQLIRELGIADRVTILPPYRIEDAVKTARPYTIGLSLESPASMNMDLTSTNKFFEYAMAGLAIVSTRTEGLRHIVAAANLGLIYEPGDSKDLASQIQRLYDDRELLSAMRTNAREYAVREGNLGVQLRRFREVVSECVLNLLDAPAKANGHGEMR